MAEHQPSKKRKTQLLVEELKEKEKALLHTENTIVASLVSRIEEESPKPAIKPTSTSPVRKNHVFPEEDSIKPSKFAVATSGGGVRAFIESAAFTEALREKGLLKDISYYACLSGSSWFVATLITSGHSVEDFMKILLKIPELDLMHINAPMLGHIVTTYWDHIQTGIWAELLTNITRHFIPELHNKLENNQKDFPFPLFTATTGSALDSANWYEFSTKWVAQTKEYNKPVSDALIPLKAMPEENDLQFLMAIWGSAYCATVGAMVKLENTHVPAWFRPAIENMTLTSGPSFKFDGSTVYNVGDAGRDFNIPLHPLLVPERRKKYQDIIVYDSTWHDTPEDRMKYMIKEFQDEFGIDIRKQLGDNPDFTVYQCIDAEGTKVHYIPAVHGKEYGTKELKYSQKMINSLYQINLDNALTHLDRILNPKPVSSQ